MSELAVQTPIRGFPRINARALIAAALLGLLATEALVFAQVIDNSSPKQWLWMDYYFYRDLGARWLADGQWYLPHQLEGEFVFQQMVDNLYPPLALLLFVPTALLPPVLWWAVPIGLLAYALYRWRPSPWAWAAIAILMIWPRSIGAFLYGNSDIWVMTAVTGGLLVGWPLVLILLKPSFAPLLLLRARDRSLWIAAGVLAIISLANAATLV